jgi:hypothetical protein
LALKISSNTRKQGLELLSFEYGRGSSAKEDGIHNRLELPTQRSRSLGRVIEAETDAVNVALKYRRGEYIRGKVAVTALAPAEGYGDIQTKRH